MLTTRGILKARPFFARNLQAKIHPIKFMCSKPTGEKAIKKIVPSNSRGSRLQNWFNAIRKDPERAKRLGVNILIGAGGLIVVYGVSKTMLSITSYFMNINFKTVGYVSFTAGFVSATICCGGLLWASRYVNIRPEPAFRLTLKQLKVNSDLVERLGSNIKPGKLRAYNITSGHFGTSTVTKTFGWRAPKVQMLYHVVGSRAEGMVTIECQRGIRGALNTNLIAVDVLDGKDDTGELLLIKGSTERLHVVGQLRGFLQSERVRYLKQYRNAEDD